MKVRGMNMEVIPACGKRNLCVLSILSFNSTLMKQLNQF